MNVLKSKTRPIWLKSIEIPPTNQFLVVEHFIVFLPSSAPNLLYSAVPNPLNPATEISYEMAASGHARLSIYDASGRLIRTLLDGQRDAGRHNVTWNGRDETGRAASAGVYLYRFEAGNSVQTRRMTLIK